ncbi:MAG: HAD family hydrolase [Actinomycetota bacterium]
MSASPDRRPRALVIDFGGVLTTSLGDAFRAFCRREGADYEHVRAKLRQAYGEADPESLVAKFETGRIGRDEFEAELATALSEGLECPIDPHGLVARMIADLRMDERMVSAVRSARAQGIRTALLSNSWGVESYPHELLADLFDEVVISGQAGLRKPDPQAFRLAAERLGLPPEECVFVDDVRRNVDAAQAVGMRGLVHERAELTVPALESLLRRQLR